MHAVLGMPSVGKQWELFQDPNTHTHTHIYIYNMHISSEDCIFSKYIKLLVIKLTWGGEITCYFRLYTALLVSTSALWSKKNFYNDFFIHSISFDYIYIYIQ